MSYDLDLGSKSFNITYNISGMFYDYDKEKGIRGVYGKTAKESIPWLIGLHNHLILNRERLLQYESKNCWGTWAGTLGWVNRLIIAASEDADNNVWEGD